MKGTICVSIPHYMQEPKNNSWREITKDSSLPEYDVILLSKQFLMYEGS